MGTRNKCPICGSAESAEIACIKSKPAGETEFNIPASAYTRTIVQCKNCGVMINKHNLLGKNFYSGVYNEETYKDKLSSSFSRIMGLPIEKSDNKRRVARINEFMCRRGFVSARTSVLDIGSGLCVFLAEMKKYGYSCVCVDPDPVSIAHSLETAGVDRAYVGSIDVVPDEEGFDLITFNKVLEHVETPVMMLKKSLRLLANGGIVYVELPDSEGALELGSVVDREEFYIEHLAIFNLRSLSVLAEKAGFKVLHRERIVEPSGKASLLAFMEIRNRPGSSYGGGNNENIF